VSKNSDGVTIDAMAEMLLRDTAVCEVKQLMGAIAPGGLDRRRDPRSPRHPPRREGTGRRAAAATGRGTRIGQTDVKRRHPAADGTISG
jgi:hypothetical protein